MSFDGMSFAGRGHGRKDISLGGRSKRAKAGDALREAR